MGGDRADQNISLTGTSVRGKKWYSPWFSHWVDMSMQNALAASVARCGKWINSAILKSYESYKKRAFNF